MATSSVANEVESTDTRKRTNSNMELTPEPVDNTKARRVLISPTPVEMSAMMDHGPWPLIPDLEEVDLDLLKIDYARGSYIY